MRVLIKADKNNIDTDEYSYNYITAAGKTTRDYASKLQRVNSSNIWAYGFEMKNRGDRYGTAMVQFKNKYGQPGEVYIYYDVPFTLWRKWQATNSKGHFFWQYIRNNFKYAKLTGDKRTHLPNGI